MHNSSACGETPARHPTSLFARRVNVELSNFLCPPHSVQGIHIPQAGSLHNWGDVEG